MFASSKCAVLLNPRLPQQTQQHVQEALKHLSFDNHIIIASSGTTSKLNELKLIALSKEAVVASAKAVNGYLEASCDDVWLNSLPEFHVGGLGILARAYLSKSKVIPLEKWDVDLFLHTILTHRVTLTSLVPTQLYDLVMRGISAPKSLRRVIIGGGALNTPLYEKAKQLNWPLNVTYGLSENASQVAASGLNLPKLLLLNHVEAKINHLGFLQIKSPALLSAKILISENSCEVIDPKVEGWYTTEDLAEFQGKELRVLGRSGDFIKIAGESVLFSLLEKKLEEIKFQLGIKEDAALIAVPDERLGTSIHLATVSSDSEPLTRRFNAAVMPYERIRKTQLIDQIPRTALGKLDKNKLLNLLLDKNKPHGFC